MGRRTQHTARGWEISDVERLVGLPRRYIQRACYAGKDGVAILAPETNARERVYGVRDLATLFVVRLLRDERYSRDHQRHTLGEVRDAIVRQEGDVVRILETECELLRDLLEEVADQYVRACALSAALVEDGSAQERLAALADELGAVSAALDSDEGPDLAGLPGVELLEQLLEALGDPSGYEGNDMAEKGIA